MYEHKTGLWNELLCAVQAATEPVLSTIYCRVLLLQSSIFALASIHFPQPSFDVSCALDDLERMGEKRSVLPVTLG